MNSFSPQPRFRIYTKPSHYLQVFTEILLKRNLSGNDLDLLTKTMKDYFNIPYVLPMPTARYAIYLAIKHMIKPGQKVLLSPITIVDVINMVICAGGIPVFIDVEPNTCNISAEKLASMIDEDTGAVLVTHLHGLACEIDKIKNICDDHQIPLIEDCAQALSTRYKNKIVGTFGTVGIFSFGMYKNVNAFYGGMLITDDKVTYDKVKAELEGIPNTWFPLKKYLKKVAFAFITDIATSPGLFQSLTYWVTRFAFLKNINFINNILIVDRQPMAKTVLPDSYRCKMMPIQARLILKQLSDIEKNNKLRIKNARYYYEGLKDIPQIILPPMLEDGSHLYTYYAIQVPDRRDLMRFSLEHKRDWVLSHYHNCAGLSCFSEYNHDCPEAQRTANSLIYLPTYPRYGKKEVDKNIAVLRKYFGKT